MPSPRNSLTTGVGGPLARDTIPDVTADWSPEGRRHSAVVGGLVLLVVAVEAAWFLLHSGFLHAAITDPDGIGYHLLATNLLDHHAFSSDVAPPYRPTMFRTPGYPAFLAVVYTAAGRSVVTGRLANFALLAATSWLLYILALRFNNRRAAALSALLCATYLPLVFFCVRHLTELLSSFLAVLFVLLIVLQEDLPQQARRGLCCGAAGLACGLASQVRPAFSLLPCLPVLAFLMGRAQAGWRERAGLSLGLGIGHLMCIVPWLVRNALICGTLVPLVSFSALSLVRSVDQYSYRSMDDFVRSAPRLPVPASVEQEMKSDQGDAREAIRLDRQAREDVLGQWQGLTWSQVLHSLPLRLAYLWNDGDTPAFAPSLHLLARLQYIVLLALMAWGCWLGRGSLRRHWPLWLVAVYLTGVHLVFHVESRYSFPARPFFMIYAGLGLSDITDRLRQRAGKERRVRSATARTPRA